MGQPTETTGTLLEDLENLSEVVGNEPNTKSKTKIFEYKGYVGIVAGDSLVNDPTQPGQLGCIVSLKDVEISQAAFEILKGIPKSNDDIGDVMCWDEFFGWMGGPAKVLSKESEGDRDYNPNLLSDYIAEVEPTQSFKDFIDNKAD